MVFVAAVILITRLLKWITRAFLGERTGQVRFWLKRAISVIEAILLITAVVSIWFNDPARLASAASFITAIASQRVITAISAYLIILGKTFHVGDRIVMAGVHGDVVRLGFMQTTIMEMGQPPHIEGGSPRSPGWPPASTPAGWLPSRTTRSSIIPCITTPKNSHISEKRCTTHSL